MVDWAQLPAQSLSGLPWDAIPMVSVERDEAAGGTSGNTALSRQSEEQTLIFIPSLAFGSNGDLKWVAEGDPAKVRLHTLGTKRRMMVPMLNDHTRNGAYARAIQDAVVRLKGNNPQGRGPKVLDIGAGTGLLSLLAARAGAREVLACEMNPALAEVLREIVAANGMSDVIKVAAMRSTDVTLAQGDERFDLIITETLDSDLLNEGIVGSMRSAYQDLGLPECELIPDRATVFAQVFGCAQSALDGLNAGVFAFDDTHGLPVAFERTETLELPVNCEQFADMHPAMVAGGLKPLSCRAEVLRVDFGDAARNKEGARELCGRTIRRVQCPAMTTSAGVVARFVVTSWELFLSKNKDEIPLSTCPFIEESDSRWQDHWFPVVSPLKTTLKISSAEDIFNLELVLSEGQLTVQSATIASKVGEGTVADITLSSESQTPQVLVPNEVYDRRRVAQLADSGRSSGLRGAIMQAIADVSASANGADAERIVRVLDISDGALCAALLANDSKPNVHVQSTIVAPGNNSEMAQLFWQKLCGNGSVEFVDNIDDALNSLLDEEPVVLASDLYYADLASNSVLSALRFLNQVRAVLKKRSPENMITVRAAPASARLMCAVASFPRLAQALRPPHNILGFDHLAAVEPWEAASEMIPATPWCYEHSLLTKPACAATFHFDSGKVAHTGTTLSLPFLDTPPNINLDEVVLIVWVEQAHERLRVQAGQNPVSWPKWWDRALLRLLSPTEPTTATVLDTLTFTVVLQTLHAEVKMESLYFGRKRVRSIDQ